MRSPSHLVFLTQAARVRALSSLLALFLLSRTRYLALLFSACNRGLSSTLGRTRVRYRD